MKTLAAVSAFVGKTFAAWVILFAVLGFFFRIRSSRLAVDRHASVDHHVRNGAHTFGR